MNDSFPSLLVSVVAGGWLIRVNVVEEALHGREVAFLCETNRLVNVVLGLLLKVLQGGVISQVGCFKTLGKEGDGIAGALTK